MGNGAAKADLDHPLRIEQPFLDGATKRSAVIVAGAEEAAGRYRYEHRNE